MSVIESGADVCYRKPTGRERVDREQRVESPDPGADL